MPDKITTLKLVDNTDVFPNIKDENVPDTIMRIADLSKYLNQLKSININGDINATTIASDIATFMDVHVDGNLFVNGIDNIVDKNGNKIINTGAFDSASDNPAGQKSIDYAIMKADILARISKAMRDANKNMSIGYVFSYMTYSNLDFSFIDIGFLYFGYGTPFNLDAHFMFGLCRQIVEIPYNYFLGESFFKHISKGDEMFGECSSLVTIGAYDFASITNLAGAFGNCISLKHIHIKNFVASFDISASTKFEESDLVEILNNLMDLTGKTSQTLTMGATNLAKLTDAEKAIATNKNWVLA